MPFSLPLPVLPEGIAAGWGDDEQSVSGDLCLNAFTLQIPSLLSHVLFQYNDDVHTS